MLDCRQCNVEKISDLAFVHQVLDELPTAIGMTKIIPPYVFPYSGLVPEDKGITGMVIIAESHLTFHSFVEKDYFFFDIFSCKPFDVQQAVDYIINAFEVKDYELHQASRGRYFPRQVPDAPDTLPLSIQPATV
jgi:S-adenosylmethionine decarboxylase